MIMASVMKELKEAIIYKKKMKTWMSSFSMRIYFMCLIFGFSFGDLIET